MKYLNTYKLFESITDGQFFKTKNEIENWLYSVDVEDFIINKDMIVDAKVVNISHNCLKYIPVQFGEVGYFDCSNNFLTSLKGCPKTMISSDVNGFECSDNQLVSLEFCPEYINGDFDCLYNKIKSFKYFPRVKGNINFYDNPVYELYNTFKIGVVCSEKQIIEYFNDYNVIINNNFVNLDNFRDVVYMMGIDNFDYSKLNKLKYYKLI